MAQDEFRVTVPQEQEGPKATVVANSSELLRECYRVARFRGRPMVEITDPYPHFVPLHKDRFERMAYPLLGGVTRSRMNDVFAFLSNTAQDLTYNDRFVLFGLPDDPNSVVWDMDRLEIREDIPASDCVWRSPYAMAKPSILHKEAPLPFVMSLAGGSQDIYDDIMQSLAPLVMGKKPDGVIWWVGDGANGKSTLMDAIYKIFPGQLSSITVKRLTDGRDTPSLNGTLANIVKESSEGRIDDTEIYKAIGTHEDFRVHKFHSQDDIEIRGNMHHIFSANNIPSFNDKGHSTQRRTFIVPFRERFENDPTFEERTFTKEMFGRLIAEMMAYAVRVREQGYRYKWSAVTLSAKASYDAEASNAEEYAKHLISQGVVAFDSFNPVRMDYENWCGDNGYVPLGVGNLRRALQTIGFERTSVRQGDTTTKKYLLPNIEQAELQPFHVGRPGLYTTPGFRPQPEETPVPPRFEDTEEEAETEKPAPKVKTATNIVGDKW